MPLVIHNTLLIHVIANGNSTPVRAETETIRNGSVDLQANGADENALDGDMATSEMQAKSTDTEADELPAKVPDHDQTNIEDPTTTAVTTATADKPADGTEPVEKHEEDDGGDRVIKGDEDTVVY